MDAKTIARLRGLFGVDEEGKVFLRVTTEQEPAGELKNAVNTNSNRSLETLIANAIVLDENGNPSLRLTGVEYGSTVYEQEIERNKKMKKALEEKKAKEQAEAQEILDAAREIAKAEATKAAKAAEIREALTLKEQLAKQEADAAKKAEVQAKANETLPTVQAKAKAKSKD